MKEIKLTLPGDEFTRADAIRAEKRDGTLAKMVSDTINDHQKDIPLKVVRNATHKQLVQTVCDTANKNFDETRRGIDARVMDYLFEHDGDAGSFPDYFGGIMLGINEVETAASLRFMYFGEDFEVTQPESGRYVIDRKSRDFVYRNCYTPRDLEEYSDLESDIFCHPASVKLRKCENWELENPAALFVFLLALLLPAGSSLLCLIWEMAAGAMSSGPLKAFVEGPLASLSQEGFQGFIRNAATILLMPAKVCADTGEWSFLFAALSVVTLVLLAIFCHQAGILRAMSRLRPLKRELKKLSAENERWKKHCSEISEQWHQAWFQWTKTHLRDTVTISDLYE